MSNIHNGSGFAFLASAGRATLTPLLLTAGFHAFAQEAPVPAALHVAPRESLVLRVHASGDQIYSCDGAQWVPRGPDARLTNDAGQAAGSHSFGPAWRWADSSSVTARAVASATPDANSIPWLLMRVTGHEGGGALNGVTSIQRLHTNGGKPPMPSCTQEQKNETLRVPYTADYHFFSAPR
jgi:Protein of unknown function (DUF3455)